MRAEDINSIESEAGIIASLIHNPEFAFYSEFLLPNHFTDKSNRCMYTAICDLVKKGITTIDPYNIIEDLNSSEATRKYADELTIGELQEFIETSDVLARRLKNTECWFQMLWTLLSAEIHTRDSKSVWGYAQSATNPTSKRKFILQ